MPIRRTIRRPAGRMIRRRAIGRPIGRAIPFTLRRVRAPVRRYRRR